MQACEGSLGGRSAADCWHARSAVFQTQLATLAPRPPSLCRRRLTVPGGDGGTHGPEACHVSAEGAPPPAEAQDEQPGDLRGGASSSLTWGPERRTNLTLCLPGLCAWPSMRWLRPQPSTGTAGQDGGAGGCTGERALPGTTKETSRSCRSRQGRAAPREAGAAAVETLVSQPAPPCSG